MPINQQQKIKKETIPYAMPGHGILGGGNLSAGIGSAKPSLLEYYAEKLGARYLTVRDKIAADDPAHEFYHSLLQEVRILQILKKLNKTFIICGGVIFCLGPLIWYFLQDENIDNLPFYTSIPFLFAIFFFLISLVFWRALSGDDFRGFSDRYIALSKRLDSIESDLRFKEN